MKKLDGNVAIVTGASSGIGRAIAILSAREGAKVVCSDIRKSPLLDDFEQNSQVDTDQLIIDEGGDAIFVECDVSKFEQVENLINTAVEKFGRLDIIFNNAGISIGHSTIIDVSDEQFDRTINVNLRGVWYCCKAAIKQFLKQGSGGKIVNVSSIGGISGIPLEPEYCASKGAVTNLTRQLAVDFGEKGIFVNAVGPCNVATAMIRHLSDEQRDHLLSMTPLHRMSIAEDIAKPAIFLASSDADYITGSILMVDGGMSCRH